MVRRLAWLTALALVMSCGGDPAPTDVENPASVKRKKKKKKKKKKRKTEVADASEDTPKKKSETPEEKRRRQDEEDAREAEARRERIRKREAEAAKAEEEEQAVASDEGGDSSDEDEEEKAEEKRAAAEEKKRKKQEAAEKKRLAAEEKKRKKQEAAEAKRAAAEAKKKQKKNKEDDVEEESFDDEEVADSDEEETKKPSKKDKAKAKKKEPEEEPEEETEVAEADIDMEEDEGGSLPPPDPENESAELDLDGGAPQRDLDDETDVAPPMFAIDRRPLTQPKGKFDVHGGLRVAAITTTGAMGASTTATSEGLGIGATYGVSDKLQVSFDYTIGINPGSIKGPLALSGAYRVKQTEKLDVALSGGFAVDFVTTTDPMTMMTSSATLKALQFGIWTRYHLGAKASVFTGLPALPNASSGLSGAAGLPPLPYHLSLGLGEGATIALELPVGVGYQASPKLYAMAMTSLAHIDMNNSAAAFLFADYIPFTVGGFYAKDAKLDIGAVLSDDVKQGLGYLRFDVVARYYLK